MGVIDVSSFFPIKAFSQSEIIEFAREPQVRLTLTDDLIDKSAETIAINGAKVDLDENAAQILAVTGEIAGVRDRLKVRAGLEEELQQIDAVVTDARVLAQELWYEERRVMGEAERALKGANEAENLVRKDVVGDVAWPEDEQRLPNAELLSETRQALERGRDVLVRIDASAREELSSALEVGEATIQRWKERFALSEQEYQERLNELGQAGSEVQALADRRKGLQEKKATLDAEERRMNTDLVPKHSRLVGERDDFLNALQANRRELTGNVGKRSNL